MEFYDELDSQGNPVRVGMSLPMNASLPEGHTWRRSSENLQLAKEARKRLVNQWREEAITADCTVEVNNTPYIWQADWRSQTLLANAVSLTSANAIPGPTIWRTKDNQAIPVNPQVLKNIAAAVALQTQNAYTKSWTLKAQIDACATISEVNSVVW